MTSFIYDGGIGKGGGGDDSAGIKAWDAVVVAVILLLCTVHTCEDARYHFTTVTTA